MRCIKNYYYHIKRVLRVKKTFRGVKNGKHPGIMFCTAQSVVVETKKH